MVVASTVSYKFWSFQGIFSTAISHSGTLELGAGRFGTRPGRPGTKPAAAGTTGTKCRACRYWFQRTVLNISSAFIAYLEHQYTDRLPYMVTTSTLH